MPGIIPKLSGNPGAIHDRAPTLGEHTDSVLAQAGFDAAAPNYGVVPENAEEVLRGACPVVASYGRRDLALRGAADRLDGVLDRIGVAHDVKEYPDAGHSFLNRHNLGPFSVLEKVAGFDYH